MHILYESSFIVNVHNNISKYVQGKGSEDCVLHVEGDRNRIQVLLFTYTEDKHKYRSVSNLIRKGPVK